MVLMDVLLNFSRSYLPETRGGTMDIPIVLTTILNPKEVDDEVHVMEAINKLPLEFYEKTELFENPSNLNLELIENKLEKPDKYENIYFTHDVSNINLGPTRTTYVQFKSMKDKVGAQFELHKKIRAVDAVDAAEKLILSHFIPDLYGNLRKFSQQTFRCVNCNEKYRRVPLIGKCRKCGGKIVLTVYQGGVTKYLKLSQEMAQKYDLPIYLKQRLELLEKDIASIFVDEKAPQVSLSEFM
jgi:DNA polymerase II large subunit